MGLHRNPSIAQWIQRIFNFKVTDSISSDVGKTIMPVIPILPVVNIVRGVSRSTTGDTTIFTTPTDRDFYLTSYLLDNMSDATADNTFVQFNFTVNGVVRFIRLVKITTTASNKIVSGQFNPPILIDRGTGITVGTAFTVGASNTSAFITGYTIETLSASSQ